ncbi:hypothetical protein BDV06DRAFT_191767 [Aspergillus oleicola]
MMPRCGETPKITLSRRGKYAPDWWDRQPVVCGKAHSRWELSFIHQKLPMTRISYLLLCRSSASIPALTRGCPIVRFVYYRAQTARTFTITLSASLILSGARWGLN